MALVWVLTGAKTGDNAQALRAANAMGLPFVEKRLAVKAAFATAKPSVRPTLDIFDLAASDPIEAPWPDLVITIGRRLSLAGLWIKRQSGGLTRIALFNAPKGMSEDFDLIVAPGYYRIAEGPNVCRIGLPLIAANEDRIAQAKKDYAIEFSALPRPLHVLLLGGDMGTARLDPDFASETVRLMQAGFAGQGTIFASTSRRTPAAAADAVQSALRPKDRLYRWREDQPFNPYFGLLAHGDSFTVTADSLSMLTEVARLGKPLAIATPPQRPGFLRRLMRPFAPAGARDLGEAADYLLRGGHAVRLGARLPAVTVPPPDDTLKVAEALKRIAMRH